MFRKYKFLTKSIIEEELKKYIKDYHCLSSKIDQMYPISQIRFFLHLQGKYTWVVIETDSIITQGGAFQIICKKPE